MQAPYAVFVTRLGGPEVLEPRPIPMPTAQAGQVVIEHTAVAVNFVDIYLRAGQPHSHNPEPPFVPGVSAVGRVIEVGPDVEGLQIGDRVTYTNAGVGSYCTHVAPLAERAEKLRARCLAGQRTEVAIDVVVLNRMLEAGNPFVIWKKFHIPWM